MGWGIRSFMRIAAATAAVFCNTAIAVSQSTTSTNWNGLYIGYQTGHFQGRSVLDDLNIPPNFYGRTLKPEGTFGGFVAGYNRHLSPNWVAGFEIDFFASRSGRISTTVSDIPFTTNTTTVEAFGSSRVRLGYSWNKFLIFGTAGMAIAKVRTIDTGPPVILDARSYHVGWTAGAGVEYQVLPNWSVKAEYLFANFGQSSTKQGDSPIPLFPQFSNTIDLKGGIIRVGVNYRFDASSADSFDTQPTKRTWNWDGTFIGIHAVRSKSKIDFNYVGEVSSFAPSGFAPGVQFGFNWQLLGNFVLGMETDWAYKKITDEGLSIATGLGINRPGTGTIDHVGSVRARFGINIDRVLLFGTAGVGFAHVETYVPVPANLNPVYSIRRNIFHVGPTYGAGVELALDATWSVKAEYLRYNFGDSNQIGVNYVFSSLTFETFKFGVNYRGKLLGP